MDNIQNDTSNFTPTKLMQVQTAPVNFEHFVMPMIHPLTGKTISSYWKLMNDPATAEIWMTAFSKDFGGAEILGDPYSKKSPLPSIGDFPCLADSPKAIQLPITLPVMNTTETHHLLQPYKNRSTIEAHNPREHLLAVSLIEIS
jgi:hypothetical protein